MLSQTVLFCVCALSLATGYAPSEPACGYERCTDAAPAPDVLNIHVIATSHDDVGWKQTVHQYYEKDVRIILDSVIKSLHGFPHRRFWLNLGLAPDAMKIYTWMEIWLLMPSSANFIFPLFFKMAYAYIYAEMVYFWMWWSDQDRETRAKVRQLVKSGQLVFVGGGWSVIDEGSTHYQSIIDQLTLGIGKLIEMFGVCHVPRTAWQYDAFGHSREVASLFATVGFDGIFFNRLDDMDRINRGHTLSTETLWRGDDDLDNSSDIFTSVMWVYRLRPHICSDPLHCPSVQDPDVNTTVTDFIDFMSSSSEYYTTRNVALYIVVDFGFRDAPNDFRKLDNVIELTNQKAAQDGLNIKAFYSTPACYLKAVKDAEPALPTKQDDFFPYRTLNRSYTGYYSSRPTIKYFEREGNSYLQMAKQLQVLAGLHDDTKLEIEELKHVMGIMQHHDAITGTQKQHVTNDFEKMLDRAIEGVLIVPQVAINKIMFGDETASPRLLFERCHLNESRCETSETSEQFVVAVYNPLAWHLDAPIRIPVVEGNYVVYGPKGKKVVSQMVEIPPEVLNLPTRMSAATLEIVFIGCFEALMIKTYFIKKIPTNKKETDNSIKIVKKNSAFNYLNGSWKASSKKTDVKNIKKRSTNAQPDNVFGNKFLQLNLNYTSNEITHVTLADGTNIKLNIKFSYYPGSGTPYWFQHDVKKPYDIGPTETSGHKGHVVQEIRITSDTASAVVRIYEGLRYIENEWVVGPIDIKDGKGKDYIIRYVTDIFNSGQFYTDSNGRQTLKRILNKRPQWDVEIDDQVAENYYPVTNKIFIQDDENRVVVLTDRSEGGTSLNEGQIELMLHRRHLVVTYRSMQRFIKLNSDEDSDSAPDWLDNVVVYILLATHSTSA